MSNTQPRRRGWRWKVAIPGIILLAAIIVLGVWLLWEAEPEDPILATGTPVPDARRFVVAVDESALRVAADSRVGRIDGSYQLAGGSIELIEQATGAGRWQVAVNLVLDAQSLNIGSDLVNQAMRRLLAVDKYPTGQFLAQSNTPLPDLDQPHTLDLVGQLELHGQVQDYTIPTMIIVDGDQITLAAEIVIDAGIFGADLSPVLEDNALDADLQVTGYRRVPGSVTPAATTNVPQTCLIPVGGRLVSPACDACRRSGAACRCACSGTARRASARPVPA
jgi:polyisoprenoid-binding protein YceI